MSGGVMDSETAETVAGEVRNLLPDGVKVAEPTPIGDDPVGFLRSAEQLLGTVADVPVAKDTARIRVRVADLVGRGEHQCRRLIDAHPSELLAENDQLARLLLLEVCGERTPAMLRGFPVLVDAAARLWSVMPSATQTEWPGVDPMFRLAAVAQYGGRGQHTVQVELTAFPGCLTALGGPPSAAGRTQIQR